LLGISAPSLKQAPPGQDNFEPGGVFFWDIGGQSSAMTGANGPRHLRGVQVQRPNRKASIPGIGFSPS